MENPLPLFVRCFSITFSNSTEVAQWATSVTLILHPGYLYTLSDRTGSALAWHSESRTFSAD